MEDKNATLWDIAGLFLKLGTTAFGGPAAHIAMLQHEVVERRGWISQAEFLDHLGASNLIPGPTSTELVIHVGRKRAGWPGLLLAGTCFILPAALMVGVIAWAYVQYGKLPAVAGLLYAVKPVVIAIILQALWKLGRTAVKSACLAAVGVIALGLAGLGVRPLAVLAAGAGLSVIAAVVMRREKQAAGVVGFFSKASFLLAGSVATIGFWPILLVFTKIGAMVFGSGYVLLAFLRADLVEQLGWLTQQQILDAVAVGQVTPGPVFTTATFLGYLLDGTPGAIAATVGIFIPAFIFVALSAPFIPKIRASKLASAALDGINVASLTLMAVVAWQLGQSALVDQTTIAVALVSAVGIVRVSTTEFGLAHCGRGIAWGAALYRSVTVIVRGASNN